MLDLSDCLVLGTISKPHGIRGNLVLKLNNLGFDDIKEMETVFLEIEGLPVPFFILEYSERGPDGLLISLEDIESEEKARELSDCKVYLPTHCIEAAESSLHKMNALVGFEVIDETHGKLGVLVEVLEISSNSLLKIKAGKEEILVPLNDQFILGFDSIKKTIAVHIPEGLLDI